MCHVSSRGGVATLRTAIHLLLTYLDKGSLFIFRRDQSSGVVLKRSGARLKQDLDKNYLTLRFSK